MANTNFETDILIVGGGIAGLTLAALLEQAEIDVRVVDGFPPQPLKKTKPTGRSVALMESSLNIIKAAGVWDECEVVSAPLKTMRIMDEGMNVEFEASDIGLEQFGYNVPNSVLRAALYETVKTHIKGSLSDYVIEDGGVLATLEDGTEIKARAIIGADGRNSTVRKIAGIKCSSKDYNQRAITCIINHSRSHDNISTEFHRPAGPLALVPLPGNQSSIVWVETPERAEALLALKDSDFTDALQKQTNDILGGLTLETKPESWPLSTIKAKALIAPRTALVAEAAHVMSPITAQGLNLSLRDVAALAETITDAVRLGLDPGSKSILSRYEKRRRLDISTRVFGVDSMNRIVSNDIVPLQKFRRTGLKAIDTIPALKTFAMNHGLAPQMDAGRLANGKPL